MTPAFSTIRFYTFTSGYKRLLYDYAAPVLLHLFHRFGLKAETGIQNKFNLNLCIMKSLRNRVQLIGHVGQDPEIIAFDGGEKTGEISFGDERCLHQSKWRQSRGHSMAQHCGLG